MFGCQDQKQHAIDMVLADIDLYEMFYFKHCHGQEVQLALCEGIVFCLQVDLFSRKRVCSA